MNPELQRQQFTPEQAPAPRLEQVPGEYGQTLQNPERSIEYSAEREQAMKAVDIGSVPPPPVAAMPMPVPAQSQVTVASDNVPTVANDDDLIEKEWVDHAKKIIAETKDDPYRREREVNKLQIEYLRKRYGKELGESD